jgi:hypothetical protein
LLRVFIHLRCEGNFTRVTSRVTNL